MEQARTRGLIVTVCFIGVAFFDFFFIRNHVASVAVFIAAIVGFLWLAGGPRRG